MKATDPAVTFLLVLAIGVVAGILFDWLAGPSWLARQFSGSTRAIVTSALVGVAGAFSFVSYSFVFWGSFFEPLIPILGSILTRHRDRSEYANATMGRCAALPMRTSADNRRTPNVTYPNQHR
jgi:Protein of unknown function (DUF456)